MLQLRLEKQYPELDLGSEAKAGASLQEEVTASIQWELRIIAYNRSQAEKQTLCSLSADGVSERKHWPKERGPKSSKLCTLKLQNFSCDMTVIIDSECQFW